ncbi:hypothetical protein PMKS-001469 [Pichia membranifaciens]|uniref:Zn(2)-C6 fungal-type domain-containing protein n=1 Tax=Pichia membranifaciens TaxID=4926 RepID=A0A1Q2YET6_9ASCO|nr:hypothetical protein PMKS-001469 [Pichia membranifaciens]
MNAPSKSPSHLHTQPQPQNMNSHNHNHNGGHANSVITPSAIPFDLSNWEDAPDLNFLLDSQNASVESPNLPSALSPMNNINTPNNAALGPFNGLSQLNGLNFGGLTSKSVNEANMAPNSNPSSNPNSGSTQNANSGRNSHTNQTSSTPVDYAMQLQHYQNLLLETQSLLNMKQLQQKSPASVDQPTTFNKAHNNLQQTLQQQNKNHDQSASQASAQTQGQSQSQSQKQNAAALLTANQLDSANFQNFVPNFNANSQALLQQQILQLAQAQMSNNKLFNTQFNPSLAAAAVAAGLPTGIPSVPSVSSLPQENMALPSYLTNSLIALSTPAIPVPSPLSQNATGLQNNGNNNNNNSNISNFSINAGKPASSTVSSSPTELMKRKVDIPQPRTKVRPCDHCRRRKTKCVMFAELHSCKACQQKGIKCTFNEASSIKRSMSSSDQDHKRMKFEDPTIEPPPNIPVRDAHPIKDYSTMQGHSLLKKTLSLQFPRSSFYVGPTSIYDPLFLDEISLDKIDQFQINKSNSIRKVANSIQFLLRDDFSELLYEQSERESDTVEKYVAPNGHILIDLYFRTVHPSFPVLHKKIFLEKYARTHREFGASILAAVYILAIQWWDYEPRLAHLPKPDVQSLLRFAMRTFIDVTRRPKLSGVQAGLLLLQCQSLNVSPANNTSTDLGSEKVVDKPEEKDKVKAKGKNKALEKDIENQIQMSQQNNWLLCTQVVGLAEELGLGLDCSTWRLPKWERGLRRRLAWAVYIQDKWSSLVESRPSHIQENANWIVKPLTDEDFPERNSSFNESVEKGNDGEQANEGYTYVDVELGKESFKQTVSLSLILSEIQSTLYTPRAMEDIKQIDELLKLAKPLQLKLRQWYHSLPKTLQMGSASPKQFNANGNLQLSYFATEITLHRRIISTLYNQMLMSQSNQGNSDSQSPNSPVLSSNTADSNASTSNGISTNTPAPPAQLVFVCRNAAKTRLTASIDFVRELRTEHLHSFWHSSAPRNFALIGIFAALLYVTSSDADEASVYREYIMDYRWILKLNSPDFVIAKNALDLIDGVVRNIPGLWNEYDGVSIDHISNIGGPGGDNGGFDPNMSSTLNSSEDKKNGHTRTNSSRAKNADTKGNNSSNNGNGVSDAETNTSNSASKANKAILTASNNNANTSNATKGSASYNYDLSTAISPKTVKSPTRSNSDVSKIRGHKNKTSNSNTPVSVSFPPSPLQSGNTENRNAKFISRSKSKSPILLMSQQRNSNSFGTPGMSNAENSSTNVVQTPTATDTSTPMLISQTRISTPTRSTASFSQQARTSGNADLASIDGRSDINEDKGATKEDEENTNIYGNREDNSQEVKKKVEKLFKYDGQQSILDMTTALGITNDNNGGMGPISKLKPGSYNGNMNFEATNKKASPEAMKRGEQQTGMSLDMLNHVQKLLGLGNENGTH